MNVAAIRLTVHAEAAQKQRKKSAAARSAQRVVMKGDGQAEARLIEIYKLIGEARTREALAKADKLVHDHPTFQLAQLVYGDLLVAQTRPVRNFGDVPEPAAKQGTQMLAELREESQLRMRALRERPPQGAIPANFLQLSPRNRHAIAIDIALKRSHYWRNDKPGKDGAIAFKNEIPMEIVRIFEKHGFIWGGRWYHYDTMHFEYRPELLGVKGDGGAAAAAGTPTSTP